MYVCMPYTGFTRRKAVFVFVWLRSQEYVNIESTGLTPPPPPLFCHSTYHIGNGNLVQRPSTLTNKQHQKKSVYWYSDAAAIVTRSQRRTNECVRPSSPHTRSTRKLRGLVFVPTRSAPPNFSGARPQCGFYKIFVHCNAFVNEFVNESISMFLPPPPVLPTLLHEYCTTTTQGKPTPRRSFYMLYSIHDLEW